MEKQPKKRGRGFAAMDPEKLKQVSRKGGASAQAQGTGHRFNKKNKDEAAQAGRKGGRQRAINQGQNLTEPLPISENETPSLPLGL
jgi:general stress protein YciG